jgi:hypothetical protein
MGMHGNVLWTCSMSLIYVQAAYPCYMSMLNVYSACPCLISINIILYVHACPCYFSMHVNAVCSCCIPCCMSLLPVQLLLHAKCPCCMPHAACSCNMYMLLFHAPCPYFMSLLYMHAHNIAAYEMLQVVSIVNVFVSRTKN